MRILLNSQILLVAGLAILLTLGSSSFGQSTSNPDSLSKNSSHQNQEEREVPKGSKVHELSQGLPIAAFSAGGEKEKALEDFLREQKVAGFIILQDGKIRLERYALGHSESEPMVVTVCCKVSNEHPRRGCHQGWLHQKCGRLRNGLHPRFKRKRIR